MTSSEEELSKIFKLVEDRVGKSEYPAVTDREIRTIKKELEKIPSQLAKMPRIYTVLRLLNQLPVMNNFINNKCTDAGFPFSPESLPDNFSDISFRGQFLEAQRAVVTFGMKVEAGQQLVKAKFEDLGFDLEPELSSETWIVESSYTGK